ncbi:CBS domain-containing protein [Streptomyces sp. NPDC050560]|uniref:CBS domain-containing protein n=1 Tax=Streptomyces sp. NPDC050560 TaxID=3365630 RepID=UPI0037B86DCF
MAELVRDVMARGAVCVPPDASLVEAAQLMRAQETGEVMVATGGRVLGVLTDRDITLRAVADGVDPLMVSARSVCTPEPVTVAPDTTAARAAALMREHAVRRLPVVDDGLLVGVVGRSDLAPRDAPGRRGPAGARAARTADDAAVPAGRRTSSPDAQRA